MALTRKVDAAATAGRAEAAEVVAMSCYRPAWQRWHARWMRWPRPSLACIVAAQARKVHDTAEAAAANGGLVEPSAAHEIRAAVWAVPLAACLRGITARLRSMLCADLGDVSGCEVDWGAKSRSCGAESALHPAVSNNAQFTHLNRRNNNNTAPTMISTVPTPRAAGPTEAPGW